MNEKKTCRFYCKKKGICTALNALYCDTDIKPCAFYKPRKEEKDKKAINKRGGKYRPFLLCVILQHIV